MVSTPLLSLHIYISLRLTKIVASLLQLAKHVGEEVLGIIFHIFESLLCACRLVLRDAEQHVRGDLRRCSHRAKALLHRRLMFVRVRKVR